MSIDTSTHYLGLKLANPVVISACPLTGELDVLRKLADFGAAAAVLPSLFEEQLKDGAGEGALSCSPEELPIVEPLAHFHALKHYNRGPADYLRHLSAAKKAVSIPIIGSLNVTGPGEATRYARRFQEAGADALEVNIYFLATDPETTGQEVETRYVELVAAVRNEVTIPLAVKLSPFFTSLPNFVRRVVDAGANGVVLFNRFLQPDIDLDRMQVCPRLALSSSDELRLTLRWIALLHGRIHTSFAATSGIHFADDVVKALLAGADVTMVASTLYQHGVEVLPTIIDGLSNWAEANDFPSVERIKGALSQRRCPNPAVFERANYTRALASFLNGAETV
jgi:dihydroorotate dehydrogenase (fumarate)